MRFWFRLLVLLLGLAAAAPAQAAYCDDFGLGNPRFPDGACDFAHEARIDWGAGSSRIMLLVEREARPGIAPARLAELKRMVDEVAGASGPAIARLAGVRLPATIHLVVVNDSAGEGAYAESFGRFDGVSDCPMMVYNSGAGAAIGRIARTVTHELFHCAQYHTWPDKMAAEGSRWWSEGSAEWFEDFAMPARVGDSDLIEALRRFRERAGTYSLLDGLYGNVVLFSWLGERRIPLFISGLANRGETQLAGAARAMDGMDWQRFAQDYIDERIATPSGVRIAGGEFVPELALLHTTTGRPGEDPAWEAPRAARPLTLMSGRIDFVPALYAPSGQFGARRAVFSERPGAWGEMPNPLRVECGGMKKIRFAGLSLTEARLRVDPGTREAASRECGCPIGSWTIPEQGLMQFSPHPEARLVSHGDVILRFDMGGTASFVARNLVFDLPERRIAGRMSAGAVKVRIDRTYRGTWRWSASGNLITMHADDLMQTTERTTHFVSGPAPLGGTHVQPARTRTIESDNHDGRPKQFSCEGGQLKITDPVDRIGPSRYHVPSMNLTRYPRSGIFVRP